jgi:hypothetical protein
VWDPSSKPAGEGMNYPYLTEKFESRLIEYKVAMYEHLTPFGSGAPNAKHIALYSRWAQGGWGIIITGNVQVSPIHLGLGGDLALPNLGATYDLAPWKTLAAAMHASASEDKSIALMQLCHTGRQSPRLLGGRNLWTRPLAPSPVRLGSNVQESFVAQAFYGLIFQTPKEMDGADIDLAVRQYCFGATLAAEAGFDGVQIHGSHGCKLFRCIFQTFDLISSRLDYPVYVTKGELYTNIRMHVPSNLNLILFDRPIIDQTSMRIHSSSLIELPLLFARFRRLASYYRSS